MKNLIRASVPKGTRSRAGVAFLFAGLVVVGATAQESRAIFDLPIAVAPPSTDFRALADCDGDGRKEAISVNFPNASTIVVQAWRFGTAAPSLGWQATYSGFTPGSALATTIAVGDFNADGRDDFALSVDNAIGWWFSNGATTSPTVSWVLTRPSSIRSMVAADFDGDGRDDLVTLDATDIELFVTPSIGIPTVTTSTLGPPSPSVSATLFRVDANGDASPDFGISYVAPFTSTVTVKLYPVTGGIIGAPATIASIAILGSVPVPVPGDLDGDGDEDITIFSVTSHATLRRTSPTSFTVEPTVPGKTASALADVDGDGHRDAVGYLGTNLGLPGSVNGGTPGSIFIHRNDGAGNLLPPETIEAIGWATLAGVADLDGDGDQDIVAGRCVRWTTGGRPTRSDISASVTQYPWVVDDVDRDGDPDLGVRVEFGGTPAVTTTSIVRNEGDGTFVTAAVTAIGTTSGVYNGPGIQGDFDGDGAVDVLIANAASITAPTSVAHLLRNLGGGSFVDVGPAAPGPQYPWQAFQVNHYYYAHRLTAVVADVDLDGDLDVVHRTWVGAGGFTDPESVVWLNSGTGFFTTLSPIAGVEVLEIADFDGDHVPDALAARGLGGTAAQLAILHGYGNGTFAAPTPLPIGFDTRFRVGVADVDGDGDMDVGVANPLMLLRNQGNGTFQQTTLAATLAVPPSSTNYSLPPVTLNQAFFIDANGDGMLDLVGGPLAEAPGAMGICLATAPGNFAPPIIQPVIATSFADIDGDGDLDAITVNGAIMGNAFRGPAAGRRTQHGVGLAGTAGIEPVIGDEGPFRTGINGAVRITNGLGGAAGWFILSTATASVPVLGGLLQVAPDVLLPIQLGGIPWSAGTGSLTLPWTMPPGFEGLTLHHQAALLDPGAPQGLSFTRVLSVTIGS